MKRKEKNWRSNRKVATVIILILIVVLTVLFSLFAPLSGIFSLFDMDKCAPIELKLQKQIIEADSVYTISLKSLTDFEWTELYVIIGPRFPQEVEEITGVKYEKIIEDDRRQLIFVKEDKIVKEHSSSCRSFSWVEFTYKKGFAEISYSSKTNFRKKPVENGRWVYEVVLN